MRWLRGHQLWLAGSVEFVAALYIKIFLGKFPSTFRDTENSLADAVAPSWMDIGKKWKFIKFSERVGRRWGADFDAENLVLG